MKILLEEWKSDNLTVYVSNLDAVDMESERTLEKDQRLLWLAYAMVLIYCHLALFKNSRARSKAHLAIISCLSGKTPELRFIQPCHCRFSRHGNLLCLWPLPGLWSEGSFLSTRDCLISFC